MPKKKNVSFSTASRARADASLVLKKGEAGAAFADSRKMGEGVALPSSSLPKSSHQPARTFSLWMLLVMAGLIQTTYAMHEKYEHKMQGVRLAAAHQQEDVLTVAYTQPKSHRKMTAENQALQQQIEQMKALMENRRKVQEMEMKVLRYQLGVGAPTVENLQQEAKVEERAPKRVQAAPVDEDIDFAREVARDAVRQEVEGFLDRVELISKVGSYVTKRVTGD